MSSSSITCKVVDRRTGNAAVGMGAILRCLNTPLENDAFRGLTDSWGNIIHWPGFSHPERTLAQFLNLHGRIQTIWQMCFESQEYFTPAVPRFTVVDINFALSPGESNRHVTLSLDLRGFCIWIQPSIEINLKEIPPQSHQYQHSPKAQNRALMDCPVNESHPSKVNRQEQVLQGHMSFQPHAPLMVTPEQYQQVQLEVNHIRTYLRVLNHRIQIRLSQEQQLQSNVKLKQLYQQEVDHLGDYLTTQVERLQVPQQLLPQQDHQQSQTQAVTQPPEVQRHLQNNLFPQNRAVQDAREGQRTPQDNLWQCRIGFLQNQATQQSHEIQAQSHNDAFPSKQTLQRLGENQRPLHEEYRPDRQPQDHHVLAHNRMLQQHIAHKHILQPVHVRPPTTQQHREHIDAQLPPFSNFTIRPSRNAQNPQLRNILASDKELESQAQELKFEWTKGHTDKPVEPDGDFIDLTRTSNMKTLSHEVNGGSSERGDPSTDKERMDIIVNLGAVDEDIDEELLDAAQANLSGTCLTVESRKKESKEDVTMADEPAAAGEVATRQDTEFDDDSTIVVEVPESTQNVGRFKFDRFDDKAVVVNSKIFEAGSNHRGRTLRSSKRNKR